MNSFKTLKLDTADHIATLTLNRAHTLNSINRQFMDELGAACEQLSRDRDTRVIILTANGRGFCSGIDLSLFQEVGSTLPIQDLRELIRHWQEVFDAFEALPQITVAAINGVTLGAGIELILCCDFRIASTRALFGMPEVKLGLIPDLGGITRLTRTVGPAWAKEIVLRARNLSAMEALRVGLINRVSDPGDLNGTARKWATQFAALPPSAAAVAKRLINTAFDHDLAEGLKLAEEAQLELLSNEEFRSAMMAAQEQLPSEV